MTSAPRRWVAPGDGGVGNLEGRGVGEDQAGTLPPSSALQA